MALAAAAAAGGFLFSLLATASWLFFSFVTPPIHCTLFFERSNQTHWRRFAVQKIAKSTPTTHIFVVIATAGFAKVSNRREFHVHGPAVVIASVHDLQCIWGLFFVFEFDVDMTNHVISEIVHHVQFVQATEFGKLTVQVFVETQKVFSSLFRTHWCGLAEFGLTDGVLVEILHEEGGGECGFVVQPTAAIGMATGTNFEVKRTVHLIFFGTVNASQVLGHCVCWLLQRKGGALEQEDDNTGL
jgi:hypothetical protein